MPRCARIALAIAFVSLCGSEALAAFGDFSYTSQVAIGAGPLGATASITPAGTANTITLTAQGEAGLNGAQSGTDIVFGTIAVTSTSAVDQSIGTSTIGSCSPSRTPTPARAARSPSMEC